jgi:hypothetical protein
MGLSESDLRKLQQAGRIFRKLVIFAKNNLISKEIVDL